RRRRPHLVGGDRGVTVVRRLEDAWVADDFGGRRRRLRAEPHQELLVAGERPGEAGDRRGHPLIAGDDGFHGPVFGPQKALEHGRPAVLSHSLTSSHTAAVAGVGPTSAPPPYNPRYALRPHRPPQWPPRDHRGDALPPVGRRGLLGG